MGHWQFEAGPGAQLETDSDTEPQGLAGHGRWLTRSLVTVRLQWPPPGRHSGRYYVTDGELTRTWHNLNLTQSLSGWVQVRDYSVTRLGPAGR